MTQFTFDQVYIKFRSRIERFLQVQYGCSAQDAEDITGDVFLLLYTKWENFSDHDEKAILKFLYTTAKYKAHQFFRKQRKAPATCSIDNVSEAVLADESTQIDIEDENKRYSEYVAQIKPLLSDTERITFEYMVIKNYTAKQIARELNTTEICIHVRQFRIRKKLEKLLPQVFGGKL